MIKHSYAPSEWAKILAFREKGKPRTRRLWSWVELENWKHFSKTPVICSHCGMPAFYLMKGTKKNPWTIWDRKPVLPDGAKMVKGLSIDCYWCGALCRGIGANENLDGLEMIVEPFERKKLKE